MWYSPNFVVLFISQTFCLSVSNVYLPQEFLVTIIVSLCNHSYNQRNEMRSESFTIQRETLNLLIAEQIAEQ